MKGFKHYTGIDEALDIVLKTMRQVDIGSETILLDEALNRVLASDIVANVNIPQADRSAMDGYAVIAEDTFGASETNPAILNLAGKVEIDKTPQIKIEKGKAVAVATGSYMPKGADAVVMVEYTKMLKEVRTQIVKAVVPGQNVSKIGEDVKKGQVVVKKGTKIQPQDIGILAALGIARVPVVIIPKVAVISTGDELIDLGEEQKETKIYDINRHLTMASVTESGGEPLDLGIAKDNPDDIRNRLKQALSSADMVLISAGTSVGEKDLIPAVLKSLEEPGMLVHGVSLRPGYPTGLAVIDGKPVISLPGYPVSNAVAFRVFAKPLIARILGTVVDVEHIVRAKMARRVATPGGLRTFVRVKISRSEDGLTAEPIMASGAGVISSLTEADALLIIPEDSEGVDEGEEVELRLLRPIKVE
jgi:molybdenum cofactor synthesis domain-containing protein